MDIEIKVKSRCKYILELHGDELRNWNNANSEEKQLFIRDKIIEYYQEFIEDIIDNTSDIETKIKIK